MAVIGQGAIQAQRAARPGFRHLWDAEVSVYSQWGEDGIFDFICDALDLRRPRCLEIGAGRFRECNTRWLAEARSASVLAVDGRADLHRSLAVLPVAWRSTVVPVTMWVTSTNAAALVTTATDHFGGLDVVSVDLDGTDYWILESLDLTTVQVVVVEYNALFGANRAVSVPDSEGFARADAHWSRLYYGASLPAFVHLLATRGFAFVGTNRPGTNAFFIRTGRVDEWPLALPRCDEAGLVQFTDLRVRESRGRTGALTLLSPAAGRALIGALPLIDVITGSRLCVADCV